MKSSRTRLLLLGLAAAVSLSGCGLFHRATPQECMERAMYFESHRSSRDGMIAVGSVVMNRVDSGKYPRSVCGVVAQKNQFARGIMSRRMTETRSRALVREAARSVLAGERHPLIGNAMFFHTAGHRFPYDNMHYVLVTGGNAFYERRPTEYVTQRVPPAPVDGLTGW